MRRTVVCGLQNAIRGDYLIPPIRQKIDHFCEQLTVLADSQTRDVFHEEMTGLQFENQTYIFFQQCVSRIIDSAAANEGYPLARRAAGNQSNLPVSDLGLAANLSAGDACNIPSESLSVRKVVLVDRCVNRVVLDCGCDFVSGLFESER